MVGGHRVLSASHGGYSMATIVSLSHSQINLFRVGDSDQTLSSHRVRIIVTFCHKRILSKRYFQFIAGFWLVQLPLASIHMLTVPSS